MQAKLADASVLPAREDLWTGLVERQTSRSSELWWFRAVCSVLVYYIAMCATVSMHRVCILVHHQVSGLGGAGSRGLADKSSKQRQACLSERKSYSAAKSSLRHAACGQTMLRFAVYE